MTTSLPPPPQRKASNPIILNLANTDMFAPAQFATNAGADGDEPASSEDQDPNLPKPPPLTKADVAKAITSRRSSLFQMKEPNKPVTEWLAEQDAVIVRLQVSDARVAVDPNGRRLSATLPTLPAKILVPRSTYYEIHLSLEAAGVVTSFCVERSMTQFQAFRAELKKRFPGAALPPLPRLNTLPGGTTKLALVEKRTRQFELFSQNVAENPFFRNDPTFTAFFEVATPFVVDPLGYGEGGEGVLRWLQAVKHVPRPKNRRELVEIVTLELRSALSQLIKIKASAKEEIRSSVSRAECHRELAQSLEGWLSVEKTNVSPIAGPIQVEIVNGGSKPGESSEATLPEALETLVRRMANHSSILLRSYGLAEFEQSVLDHARFEIATIHVWFDLLEEAKQSEKRMMRAQAELASVDASKPASLRVVNAKEHARQIELMDACYERGLLCVELLRYRQARVLRMMRLRDRVEGIHADNAKAIVDVWSGELEAEGKPAPAPAPPAPAPKPASDAGAVRLAELEALILRAKSAPAPPPSAPQTKDAIAVDHAYASERFWILMTCVVAMQLLFAVVILLRGSLRDALPLFAVSFVTYGTGKVADLALSKHE